MSTPSPSGFLDLRRVEAAQRALLWERTAGSYFPGLSVHDLRVAPSVGLMQGGPFGPGQLWRILSPALHVSYMPRSTDPTSQTFSVMLQMQGSTLASQQRHSCCLRPREICVIDGLAPFELEVGEDGSHFMFMQVPRHMVIARYPWLERRTATVFDPHEPGSILLTNVLLNLLESGPFLDQSQCAATLAAVAQMLGVPKLPGSARAEDVSWRARSALAYIDTHLADPSLNANRIAQAQGISRRRLDEILLKAVGTPLTAQIWLRRLAQAASDLLEPQHASKTVTQIAFSVGFEDAAHFTRAFKRRYQLTPREWRNPSAREALRLRQTGCRTA